MKMRTSRHDESDRTVIEGYWNWYLDWILLGGQRETVALAFGGGFALFFAVLEIVELIPLLDTQALLYVYSGLIAGNLTLITVVVSISQLLLSQELQTPDELQPQIESVAEYRDDVEEAAGEIAPVKPLGFLQLLIETTREEAQRLGGFAKDGVITSGREDIEDIVTTLTEQIDEIDALIDESETDTFSVLSLTLETNYAKQIHRLRTTRMRHENHFSESVHESIEDLIDRLEEIDIARQYFKSIYLQQELAALSRILLIAGLPAVATAIASLLVLTVPSDDPITVVNIRLLLPVTLTIGLVPLTILCSFILHTATVTRLTAATLPFTTPEQER